jgi:hypothetical protein
MAVIRSAFLILWSIFPLAMAGATASGNLRDGTVDTAVEERILKTGGDRGSKPHRRRYECSAHKACVAAGLTLGDCCPTLDGVFLDCCATKTTTMAPSSAPTSTEAKCSAYSSCVDLGLSGDCCPTMEGVTLDCCGAN